MWHSRPPRDPPTFMAKAILNFHFDYLTPSLIPTALLGKLPVLYEDASVIIFFVPHAIRSVFISKSSDLKNISVLAACRVLLSF